VRRATWVGERHDAGELVPWAVAHGVQELFLGVRPDLAPVSDVRWAREIVRQAHAAGIAVSALGGDQGWVDHPDLALGWSRAVCAMHVFDGVHVDVEPWARSDWDDRRDAVVAGYVDVLRRLAATCPLRLEADVAFWLHDVHTVTGTPLDEAVLRLVDAVTLLSYRNVPTGTDGILDVARRSLEKADRLGVPCRLAVETNDLGPGPVQRKQTFFGRGHAAMTRALEVVDAEAARVPSYAGAAVHDVDGWQALEAGPVTRSGGGGG
jgi:hypothetical protein